MHTAPRLLFISSASRCAFRGFRVKDALKHTYLGYETKELVDVVTGEITTIQSLRHTSDLDTGEMYVFLCKVEAWAMNIGCHLTIPQSCEFQLLRDKQEA